MVLSVVSIIDSRYDELYYLSKKGFAILSIIVIGTYMHTYIYIDPYIYIPIYLPLHILDYWKRVRWQWHVSSHTQY